MLNIWKVEKITEAKHKFWIVQLDNRGEFLDYSIKLTPQRFFLMMYLHVYQARKVSGHLFVC
jgi:hypothetical protein